MPGLACCRSGVDAGLDKRRQEQQGDGFGHSFSSPNTRVWSSGAGDDGCLLCSFLCGRASLPSRRLACLAILSTAKVADRPGAALWNFSKGDLPEQFDVCALAGRGGFDLGLRPLAAMRAVEGRTSVG